MHMKDSDYINFSEAHELNHILKTIGKKQTASNRSILQHIGKEVKEQTGKSRLKHDELYPYLSKQESQFE